MSSSLPPSRLQLLSQTGIEEKVFCDDGSQRFYITVAKNAMFSMTIGQHITDEDDTSDGTPVIRFADMGVICTLVYDQNPQKQIDVISQKPMEYKLTTLQGGSQIKIDARIRVLSSQYESSLFRIHIQMLDKDKNIIPDLSLYSHPIRVRSKIKPQTSTTTTTTTTTSVPLDSPCLISPQKRSSLSCVVSSPCAKRGRFLTSDTDVPVKSEFCDEEEQIIDSPLARVLEALNRIESRQIEQQTYLENLSGHKNLSSVTSLSDHTSSCSSPNDFTTQFGESPLLPSSDAGTVIGSNLSGPRPHPVSFCDHFLHLLSVFSRMSANEKQEQIYLIQNSANMDELHSSLYLLNSLSSIANSSISVVPQNQITVQSEATEVPSFTEEVSFAMI